jgi:hypothetical protein
MNYYDFVSDPNFFEFLLKIDESIADEAHKKPCVHCGDKLNCGNFFRSGFGLPTGSRDALRTRFSFCCREPNCRRRLTPESLRFLRGMAYTSIVIVLLSAIYQGPSGRRIAVLQQNLSVSRQTIHRWIRWWKDIFVESRFWRGARGRFMPVLDETNLAESLVEQFIQEEFIINPQAEKLLGFLAAFRSA